MRAGVAPGDPVHQHRVVHLQFHHGVQVHRLLGQHHIQRRGLRQVLELAGESTASVILNELKILVWETAVEVNEKLYDCLMAFAADDTLRVVQPYTNDGFEAWRRLKLRYTLTGGGMEVDLAVRLYSRKACRNMTELPAATKKSTAIEFQTS